MVKKKVSIITVVYNACDTVEQTILSIKNQSYGIENIEYIIVDGYSTDGTDRIIEKYSDIISKVICEPDQGIYDAMNKGLKIAEGDIIGILNADDWYEESAVFDAVNLFENTQSEIIYGEINLVGYNGNKVEPKKLSSLNNMWYTMAVYHPATFVKRGVYQKLGLFDQDYRITADYDFMLRCYSSGVKFKYLDKILTNFRTTGISNTDIETCVKEHIDVALKYIDKSPCPDAVLKELDWRWKSYVWNDIAVNEPEKALEALKLCFSRDKIIKIAIWGTGVWGKKCFNVMKKMGITIKYFFDMNEKVQGTYVNGVPIYPLQKIKNDENILLLIAIKRKDDELYENIEKLNISKEQYIFIEEWMDVLNANVKSFTFQKKEI